MADLACPHCGNATIPLMSKMFLGPGRTLQCPRCRKNVSVPASSVWTAIPIIVAACAAVVIESLPVSAAIIVAGTVITVLLHYKFVPLVAR